MDPPPAPAPVLVPLRPRDPRDHGLDAWAALHRADLRRMLRYLRARVSARLGAEGADALVDWDVLAERLVRHAYATSANRAKRSPALR